MGRKLASFIEVGQAPYGDKPESRESLGYLIAEKRDGRKL
jgi:hypothetical protein